MGGLIDIYRPQDIDKSIVEEYMTQHNTFFDDVGDKVKVCDAPSREYTWNCTLQFAVTRTFVDTKFSMFNLLWRTAISRLGNFELKLMTGRAKGDYDVVSLRCFIEFTELDTRFVLKGIFDDQHRSVEWGHHRVRMDQFARLEKCTIKITM